jgi:hypothetical protein
VSVALLTAVLLVGGCSDDKPRQPPSAAPAPTAAPSYDPSLEPAAAVLALVPGDATTLTVTDFEQVRLELGMPAEETSPTDDAAFWQRAETERPMLTRGMLRPLQPALQTFGLSQGDVDWEAHFFDAADAETGWVIAFRDGTDMAAVQRAVDQGVGPLSGAAVDAQQRLLESGTTSDPHQSWAADEQTIAMVGLPANATYVARGCVPPDPEVSADVDELGAYSIQFEGSLVTARLGEGRHDLFTRMRLGGVTPGFAEAYDGGVADPRTGRIGYVMADPPTAARLALEHRLPFATCA